LKISLGGFLASSGVGVADIGMEELTKYVDEKYENVIMIPGVRPHDIFRHSLEATVLAANKADEETLFPAFQISRRFSSSLSKKIFS
jgi:hypothetical protein